MNKIEEDSFLRLITVENFCRRNIFTRNAYIQSKIPTMETPRSKARYIHTVIPINPDLFIYFHGKERPISPKTVLFFLSKILDKPSNTATHIQPSNKPIPYGESPSPSSSSSSVFFLIIYNSTKFQDKKDLESTASQ